MILKKIHPHTKLITATALIVLSFVLDYRFTFLFIIPFLGTIHGLNQSFKTWLLAWVFALPYFVMLTLISGLTFQSSGPTWFSLGLFHLSEDILVHVLMRTKSIIAMIFVILSVSFHTSKEDFLASFSTPSTLGTIAYLMSNILVSLQEAKRHAKAISIAQQTRGVSTQGSLFNRLRSTLPLMMPLVIHGMMMNQQRQFAYTVRGFDVHQPKTLLHQCIKTKHEQTIEILVVVLTITIIIVQVML
jgi:energy-coupling factor transport system permease protein